MNTEAIIKKYQAKLNARLDRLRSLKYLAQTHGYYETPALDARIELIYAELTRLQQVKYGWRESKLDHFIRQERYFYPFE